jgi:tetratricopeptide (TPR) repeat protein
MAHILSGRYVEADAALQECAAFYRDWGGRVYLGRLLPTLNMAQMHLGRYAQARDTAHEAVALNRESGSRLPEGQAMAVLGAVALAEGRDVDAGDLLRQAIDIYQADRNRAWLGEARAYAGYVARRLGQGQETQQSLAEALRLGLEVDSLLPLWAALPAVALLLADRGEVERAVELYALAWRYPAVAHSRWYEDVAGRQLAAAAASLPPQAAAAAQERGRARDVWATARELLAEMGT